MKKFWKENEGFRYLSYCFIGFFVVAGAAAVVQHLSGWTPAQCGLVFFV